MKRILTLCALITNSAFAVTVADCPQNITVKYSDLNIEGSVDDLIEELGGVEGQSEEELSALKESFKALSEIVSVERFFSLEKAKNGRCRYKKQDDDVSLEKVEIYTSRGVHKLYIQTDLGPRGILLRTYAMVESVSPRAVKFVEVGGKTSASLALAIPRTNYESYTSGGPLEFVGKAAQISASVISPQ